MTPAQRATMRLQRLNKRGMGVAQKLEQLMAGKNITLADIGADGVDMIDDKQQRLRKFLAMINEARDIIRAPAYADKIAQEDRANQLYLDDNPWMEAAKPEVAGVEEGDDANAGEVGV